MSLISGGVSTDLPGHQFLQSFEMEVVTKGAWKATITLFDPEGDRLENLIIAAGVERDVDFSFGRGARIPSENRSFTGRIAFYRPTFESHGVTLVLDVIPRVVIDAALDKQLRSFDEGQRASDIVEQIAVSRGWSTLSPEGRATIEPTIDAIKEPFSSNGESDFKFVDEQLRPQARNQDGEGGYLWFVDADNSVHFHTPNFLGPVAHQFRYARDGSGDVIRFEPSDASIFGALLGGDTSIFGGLSSIDGAASEISSTGTAGVDGAGSSVESDGGSRLDLGEGVHSYWDITTRDPAELARLAPDRFDTFRRTPFQADVEVYGTHRVDPLEFVDIDYVKRNGLSHYLSGRFRTYTVTHTVELGDWKTSFACMRGTVPGLQGTEGVNATVVNNPADAPSNDATVSVAVDS
jgi:hypothetical protein